MAANAIITPQTKITDEFRWDCSVEQMTGSPRMGTAEWHHITSFRHAESVVAAMLTCGLEGDHETGYVLVAHPDVAIRIAGELERSGYIQFGGEATSFRIQIEAP